MTDTSLTISWPGGQLTAKPGAEITIGRDPGGNIVLTSSAISRHHARISRDNGEWHFHDENSTQGSFSGGSGITSIAVSEPTDVILGQGPEAVLISMVPQVAVTTPAGVEPTRTANGRLMPVPVAGAVLPAQRPGGALSAEGIAAPTIVPATNDDRAIELTSGSSTLALSPGQTANLGRDDDNDLVVSDPTVSRHQLRVEHDGTTWQLVDLASAAGTWLDDQKVGRVTLVGEQTFTLGDRHGTTTLRTVAPGTSGAGIRTPDVSGAPEDHDTFLPSARRSSRTGSIAALTALVLVVVAGLGGGAWWLTHRPVDNNKLAEATVLIKTPGWSGSGTIIDAKKGLILTNAHVAAPQTMGTGVRDASIPDEQPMPDAARPFTIWVASGLEKAAEPRFFAQLVEADGYLDLAVLKIVKTAAGAAVEPDDLKGLVQVPIGDSSTVRSGDKVTVIGYPGVANSIAPTLTEGVVSGVQGDGRMNINNALLNLDATIAPGNSGGLAADSSGKLVGVPSLGLIDRETHEVPLFAMHPIALAAPLIAAARKGTTYVSPWTKDAPSGAKIADVRFVAPGNSMVTTGCEDATSPPPDGVYAFGFDYSGFPGGTNTDVIGVITAANDPKNETLATAVTDYPASLPVAGCATLTFDRGSDPALPDGKYVLRIGLGGNYKTLLTTGFTLGVQPGSTGTGPGDDGTAPPLG
jgi:pSer/pThr/pTyr-binding forkhead associated (FHA) protein